MKTMLAAAALAMTASALVPVAPAVAQSRYDRGYDQRYDRDDRRGYNAGYDRRGYEQDYRDEDYGRRGGRYDDRRYYSARKCRSGTGTVLGAIAGGLFGHAVAGRGDHTVGTVLGAAGGAIAGRAIDRSDCRRR